MGLTAAEKALVKYTPTIKVVYCIKDVGKKEALNPNDFVLKDIPITDVNSDTVRSLNDIKNMYAKENIYANEVLNKKRIGSITDVDRFILNSDERVIALTFDNIADCVGGTLRQGDTIDILYTNNPSSIDPTIKTQTEFQAIKVLDVKDSSGRYIDSTDKSSSATTILLAVSPEVAHLITNISAEGKFKLIKDSDLDSKTYNNITVINGVVTQK